MIIINPGSGPVADASEAQAEANIVHFIADCGVPHVVYIRIPERDDNDGRFSYLLWKEGSTRCHEVAMPGIPLDQVRFMDTKDQDIWDFPRLYVDGHSWVWMFALLGENAFEDPEWDE